MAKKIPQIIENQVQFWTRKKFAEKKLSSAENSRPIITVSREFGAKGAALAHLLGDKLGFKVWDQELLTLISKDIGSRVESIEDLDEAYRGLIEDNIYGLINHQSTNLNYILFLVKTIHTLEEEGNSIIVGRGANYACQNSESFHLRVVAPESIRIENYARQEDIPNTKAAEVIRRKDQERREFVRHNFNRDIGDSSDYDLVINSSTFEMEELAELALLAYKQKTGKNFNSGRQAAIS